MKDNWKIETKAVKGVYSPANGEPWVLPIAQSTTYSYETAENLAQLFDLEVPGHMYSRISNPTAEAFEGKMAALEGGVGALATSSGQSASFVSIANLARTGDNFLAAGAIYGGTVSLFSNTFPKMGISARYVSQEMSVDEIVSRADEKTRAVFAETLANPALRVLDFEKFSKAAEIIGVPFIVDNTFPTPYLCRPLEHGADIVVHSATKFIDGHATAVGGIIVDGGKFDWGKNDRFPEMVNPDPSYHGLVYTEKFGNLAYIVKARVQWIRDLGNYLAPMNAWLAHKGLETLHVRMDRHSSNALKVAEFLEQHPKVDWVTYPGLKSSADYELAQKYLPRGCSAVLSFGIKGGKEAGAKFMEGCELAGQVIHVGDLRTIALHPATTTHRQLSEEELKNAGIKPELIRVNVGIENVEDIIEDFSQALDKA